MEKELGRLQKLADLDIDFQNQSQKLEPFIELAKYITDSPVCAINIIDAYTQWTVAPTEDSLQAIPREESICHDTVQQDSTYEITDLSSNKRYQDQLYVTGEPNFRYYCGVQLTTSEGFNIGSICVLDTKSKHISAQQKRQLEHLGQLVVDHIERESRYSVLSEKLDELKNSLQNLNHDVRSPINGIVGITDILINDDKTNPELSKQDLTMIKDSAQAVIEKIDGVLTSVVTDGSSENNVGEASLSHVSEKIKRLYHPLAQQKNHSLTIKKRINGELSISNNFSVFLTQTIGNLVANAIKFTPEGGTINVVFNRKAEGNKPMLNIIVEDNGRGMTPDQIKAFNNGHHVVQSKGTAQEKSFGIGLAHIRQLVTQQNGSILAESNKKRGTKFSIASPLPAVSHSDNHI